MKVERIGSEILVRLSGKIDISKSQQILDFLEFKELVSDVSTEEIEISNLAKESKARWWKENKARFIK